MRKKWGIKTGYSQKSVKKKTRERSEKEKRKKSKHELLVKGKTLGMKNEMV